MNQVIFVVRTPVAVVDVVVVVVVVRFTSKSLAEDADRERNRDLNRGPRVLPCQTVGHRYGEAVDQGSSRAVDQLG